MSEPEIVNGNAMPVGVGAETPAPPTNLPAPQAKEELTEAAKRQAHASIIRAQLELVGNRLLMSINRAAPCKIKYEELGAVLYAVRTVLR